MCLLTVRFSLLVGVTSAVILVSPGLVWAQPAQAEGHPREFSPGVLSRLEDLPAGRFRARLQALPEASQQRALAKLRRFHFTELDLPSLDADEEGEIFYADHFTGELAPEEPVSEPFVAAAAVSVNPFPASLIFHSKLGAPNVLFLNFSGENVTGTSWNTSLDRIEIPAVGFSTDTDYSTFSDAEQAAIKRVWQRVAEDFAPFDIDVTTERPATFGTRTAHALITRNTDANGEPNPSSSAGGVAYVDVFGESGYSRRRPGWVFFNNLGNSDSSIATAISHEIGHNLGLSHDGKTGGTEYYNGHGSGDTSWGPIMGSVGGRNVSQWSKGEYYGANNTEDDLAIIATHLPFRPDDHGNSAGTARALVITGTTNVVSTTPDNDPRNTSPANKGILERNTDVDVFSLTTGNGPISLAVKPWITSAGARGGNLDVRLELRDANGAVVVTNNPATLTTAQIQATVAAGTYYLHIGNSGTGNPLSSTPSGYTAYGSIGQYFISGYVARSNTNAPSGPLQLSLTQRSNGRTNVLSWTAGNGGPYTLWYSTNLAAGFTRVPGALNLPAATRSFQHVQNPVPRATFYRLEAGQP